MTLPGRSVDSGAVVPRDSVVRFLLAEFRRDWARKLEGCSDPDCLSCQRKKDFIARVDAALGEGESNG